MISRVGSKLFSFISSNIGRSHRDYSEMHDVKNVFWETSLPELLIDDVFNLTLFSIVKATGAESFDTAECSDHTLEIAAMLYSITGIFMSVKVLTSYLSRATSHFGSLDKALDAYTFIPNAPALQSIIKDSSSDPTFNISLTREWFRKKRQARGMDANSHPKQERVFRPVFQSKLLHCLDVCCTFPGSGVFLYPVESSVLMTYGGAFAGPYSNTVLRPIDLSSIRREIEHGNIDTISKLLLCILRLVANCVFFNAPESDFPCTARSFLKHCYITIFDASQ